MTKEEAISEWIFRSNHIKKWLDEHGEEPSIRHYVELIDMAIDALKITQDTQESTQDLISRQDAIDGFYNVKVNAEDCTEYDIGYNDGIDYAISKLSAMPSAEPKEKRTLTEEDYHYCEDCNACEVCSWYPHYGCEFKIAEPKTGKWVRHELWDAPWYTCSECDFHGRNDYKFCPNCGARMRGEEE